MTDVSQLLKAAYRSYEPDEALRLPANALLGLSTAAAAALTPVGVDSVFDLAASRVFATAARLVSLQVDPALAEARLNAVPTDAVDPPAGVPVTELADQPISILRGIAPADAAAVAAACDVATVRDLALWPPFLAARAILDQAFSPESTPGFDPEAPADLLPKSGIYPTERTFYRRLLLDALTDPTTGATPVESASAIDLTAALGASNGFAKVATGALVTFSQSWYAQGVTLGQLLHSTSLAPGESTRIAMIDWSRRTRATASETISEAEQLSNTMTHSRAISEVTEATATEFQSGQSKTSSSSTTGQGGASIGIDLGPVAIGGSGGVSTTSTDAMTVSSSFGERDLAANYAQQINDRSQQNASSVRNRRASIVREVSQEEHEQISTRVVTNYNHMHALSIQYYEVVQAFRVTTQLERAEKCLFVPLQLLNFASSELIDRWRLVLADAALTDRVRRQLTVEYGVVEVIPQTPRVTLGSLIATGFAVASRPEAAIMMRTMAGAVPAAVAAAAPAAGSAGGVTPPAAVAEPVAAVDVRPDYTRAPSNTPAAILSAKGWNLDQLNAIGWKTGRLMASRNSDSVFVSDDALVVGFNLRDGQAARFAARRRDGSAVPSDQSTASAFAFRDPVPITELESISVQTSTPNDLRTSLVLQINVLGTLFPLDVPIALRPMTALQVAVRFGPVSAARELSAHLQAYRLHYSQAIYRALDPTLVSTLVAPFTYRGIPLGQVIDPQPVAVTGNFLVFRLSVSQQGRAEDSRWATEEEDWRRWLAEHGLDKPAPRSEIIPLPSGGVFAEAVLGRYNASEKLDITRFWNWQDSPIPITAPDIAPVQAGSRAQAEDLLPGQLSQPILNIQTPTSLPDPTGVGAIITALQQGSMFRDMSGMAQTVALAQAALQSTASGATAVGQQAGQNMKTVVDAQTERARIAAQLIAQLYGVPAGGAGAGKSSPSERGAELNAASAIDKKRGESGIGDLMGGASSGGLSGAGSAASDGGSGETQPSLEEEVLRNQVEGPQAGAGKAVGRVTDALLADFEPSDETVGATTTRDDLMVAARPGQGNRRRTPPRRALPTMRSISFYFTYGTADELKRDPGLFKFTLSGRRTVIDKEDWEEIDKNRRVSPPNVSFKSPLTMFRSAETSYRLSVKVFPLHIDGLGPADYEAQSFTGSTSFTIKPAEEEIEIIVGLGGPRKTIRVLTGQTLADEIARNNINMNHIGMISDPVPVKQYVPTEAVIGNDYTVIWYDKIWMVDKL